MVSVGDAVDTLTFSFIDRKDSSLYKQLYNFIKNEIKSGSFKSGEKLPSKRRLSSHLKISQNTVETAYQQLAAEGYIKSVPKRGYYICGFEGPVFSADNIKNRNYDIKEHKKDIQYPYDFKTNTVDITFFPFSVWSKISREVMCLEKSELLRVSHPQGDYNFRQSIAKYLFEFRGVVCEPEQIIIGAGTEYLIGLIIKILGKKSIYAVENPGYRNTYNVFKSNDSKVNLIGLDTDGISIKKLEDSDSNVVYITPSHHFPLGIIMPVSRRIQLLNWANKKDGRYIIEDDYDSEFRFNGRPIPALQGIDAHQKVIYISTFSKSLTPSMRISYIVLPPVLLEIYRKKLMFYSSTVSRFEQNAFYKFINEGHFERHLNRMRIIYRERKDKLVEELKKMPTDKIEIIGENSGLHLLVRVKGDMKERELIKSAQNYGVKVYGLSEYYIKPEPDMPNNTVVLGYSEFNNEQIENAVKLLNNAWFNSRL